MREHVAGRSALLHLVRASPDVAPGSRIGPSSGRRGYMQAPCGMVQAESNLIGENFAVKHLEEPTEQSVAMPIKLSEQGPSRQLELESQLAPVLDHHRLCTG